MGTSCSERDANFKKNVGADDLSLESGGSDPDGDGSKRSPGSIVGIVVGILLVAALAVGIVLMHNARKARNAATFASLRSERSNTRGQAMRMQESNFIAGAENPTYGWYKPQLSKQSAYEQLSAASPGNFVVRDKMIEGSPAFSIHFKSQQHIVRDAYIGAGDAGHGVRLMSARNAAPEPTFHDIPTLVDHYASLQDVSSPIQLNLDNPIYFDPNALGQATPDGVDIYSNSAVKNTAINCDGPSLPSKGPGYSGISSTSI